MNVTDDIKAKYVFGQLTLGEAFDLFDLGNASLIRVEDQRNGRSWVHDCCKKVNCRILSGNVQGQEELQMWIFDANDPNPKWTFSLSQTVEFKSNYILVEGQDDCRGDFYRLYFFEGRALTFDLAQIVGA